MPPRRLPGRSSGRPARPAPAHAAVAALANEPHISSRMTGIGRVTTRMDSATGTAVCRCPPDVVTPTGGLVERPANGPAGERFDHRDCLDHRAVGLPAPADVVDLAGSGRLEDLPERLGEVVGVEVVANHCSLVAIDRVGPALERTLCEVGEKPCSSAPA